VPSLLTTPCPHPFLTRQVHTTKEHAKWNYLFMLVMIREKPMEMYNGCAA
jgi:hypothetical protein